MELTAIVTDVIERRTKDGRPVYIAELNGVQFYCDDEAQFNAFKPLLGERVTVRVRLAKGFNIAGVPVLAR